MEVKFDNPPDKFAATFTLPYMPTRIVYWINSREGITRVEAFKDEDKQ